jgi:1,4-alpha-glucan branching enzyme
MPFMEFEGNLSWGYNPAFFFAPDKFYGPKNAVKAFVDECHAQGISVVLDMVLNHAFGQCPLVQLYWDAANSKPATNSPWFNPDAKHPFNVGYDFNHESPHTKAFVDRVLRHWVQEYKLDGFRFDLSKGFTQKNSGSDVGVWSAYDASRLAILKRMCDSIRVVDPNVIMIMEHLGSNQEEKEMADYGMMPWGKMTSEWNEATMGWLPNSDVSWSSWKARGWNQPHLLTYMESHDEERLMYKNLAFGKTDGTYNVKNVNTALARMEAAANLFFATPGPKMMWQFAELGYDKSIFMCNNGTLPTPYGNDQCKLDSKPPVWPYNTDPARQKLYAVHSAMITLHTSEPAFSSTDFTLNGAGAVKNVRINHASMNVLAFSNFDTKVIATASLPFPSDGKYYEFWSGDSIQVSGGSFTFSNIAPGEYRLYSTKKLAKPDLSVGVSAQLPAGLVQAVAYPNPATDRVSFAYTLPQAATVTLEVFSFTGARVAVLAQNEQQFAGNQLIEWNAGALPAGAYFYRLAVDGKTLSGKISLE